MIFFPKMCLMGKIDMRRTKRWFHWLKACDGVVVTFLLGVFADGSGLCYNAGGWRLVVAFAGYAGASLWGWLIFAAAGSVSPEGGRWLAGALAALVAVSWVFWGRGTETMVLSAVIVAVFALAALVGRYGMTRLILAFIGVSVAVSAIRAPLVLLVFGGESDAKTLAGLTFLPRFVWVAA